MKKGVLYFFILLILCMAGGCSSKKEKETKDENLFDMKLATSIVDTYMNYLIKDDIGSSKQLYTEELLKKNKESSGTELKVKGYQISESNQVGENGQFKVKITRVQQGMPIASLDEYSIKIKEEGGKYRINEINNSLQKEVFTEDKSIRMRSKNNVKTNLIIDQDGIPQYVFSKEDEANLYKMEVPKSKYGALALSYEGDSIAISTYEKNSYLGIIKIDEAQAVQGESKESGAGQGDSKGNAEKSGSMNIKEKPIGKEIISLDYIKNAKIDFMVFSLDEKLLMAQYKKDQLGTCLKVYRTENGDSIPIKFEEIYPLDKVEVFFSSFDKEFMNYEIRSRDGKDKSVESIIGMWKMDLKEFKVKKQ